MVMVDAWPARVGRSTVAMSTLWLFMNNYPYKQEGIWQRKRRHHHVDVAAALSHAQVTSTLPLALAATLSKAPGLTSRSVAAHPVPGGGSVLHAHITGRTIRSNTYIDRLPSSQYFYLHRLLRRTS